MVVGALQKGSEKQYLYNVAQRAELAPF